MEAKPKQKSTLKSKLFQIDIKEYEKDMETKSAKDKKKEIIDLFTNSNNLHSVEEFNNIKNDLHDACQKGDLELIKFLLSEKIKDDSNELTFIIDKKNQTATLFGANSNNGELIIPRIVKHESKEYLITGI